MLRAMQPLQCPTRVRACVCAHTLIRALDTLCAVQARDTFKRTRKSKFTNAHGGERMRDTEL